MFKRLLNNPSSMRRFSSLPSTLYKNVWRKSNILYITYVAAGCVVIEVIYGNLTNFIWESYNYGVSNT